MGEQIDDKINFWACFQSLFMEKPTHQEITMKLNL